MSDEFLQIDDNNFEFEHSVKKSVFKRAFKVLVLLLALAALLLFVAYKFLKHTDTPPDTFPVGQSIVIEQGVEIREITSIMEKAGVVQSEVLLYYIIALFHESTNIKASTYVFSEPLTTWEVAVRLTEGDFDTDLIKFTHFEGERATHIAERATEVLPNFDSETFVLNAEPLEGRLFPDTYFLSPDFTNEQLLELMLKTFTEKTADLSVEISDYTLTLDEILVLASIIEREANDDESMSLVSSVLQNRLDIGMALQADASIEYVLDKPLSELTPEDLKIDSPYNTYLNPGLPPTPIGNPGLSAIEAVLEPAESDYFYYITDDEGEFHYAETYQKHLVNIQRYLK